jgi:hypothetical protein
VGAFALGRFVASGDDRATAPCSERADKGELVSYLTDGVHLYEEIGWCQNFGLTGGGWLTVRDCRTDLVRTMCELELALCEAVPRRPARSR